MTIVQIGASKIYCSASKSLFTCIYQFNEASFKGCIQRTYRRIEKKTVHAPREWFHSSVQIFIIRRLRQGTAVLLPEVIQMFAMLDLGLIDPYTTGDHCVAFVSRSHKR